MIERELKVGKISQDSGESHEAHSRSLRNFYVVLLMLTLAFGFGTFLFNIIEQERLINDKHVFISKDISNQEIEVYFNEHDQKQVELMSILILVNRLMMIVLILAALEPSLLKKCISGSFRTMKTVSFRELFVVGAVISVCIYIDTKIHALIFSDRTLNDKYLIRINEGLLTERSTADVVEDIKIFISLDEQHLTTSFFILIVLCCLVVAFSILNLIKHKKCRSIRSS